MTLRSKRRGPHFASPAVVQGFPILAELAVRDPPYHDLGWRETKISPCFREQRLHSARAARCSTPFTGVCRPGVLLRKLFAKTLGAALSAPFALSLTAPAVSLDMAVDDVIETEGKITSVLAGTMFRVELGNKHSVLAHISGKMRKRFIRLTNGDRVKLEMSPYDLNKARIVYRLG